MESRAGKSEKVKCFNRQRGWKNAPFTRRAVSKSEGDRIDSGPDPPHSIGMIEPEKCYTEGECDKLFAVLFPNGFAGEDVLAEIAPEGWPQSTLSFIFHPTVDQVYFEALQMHSNLQSWIRKDSERSKEPEPTLEKVAAEYQDHPVEVEREVGELVASCLWDVFSDEHDVVALDGRIVHLGSFRGAAGCIADQLNRQSKSGQCCYDYLDFYMGTFAVSQRADLTPVYEMIFRRLKERLFTWRYRFPELGLVDFGSDKPDGARTLRIEKMKAELKKIHREVIEDAKQQPVPAIVLAYRSVYGTFPYGWPPWKFDQQDE